MRHRIQALGGNLTIRSTRDVGTHVSGSLPIR
jgi:signal transduction histidine kinase